MRFCVGERVRLKNENDKFMVGLLWANDKGVVTGVYASGYTVLLDGDEYVTAWDDDTLVPAQGDQESR